ncbi:hypothetical protein FB381_2817 [Nocardioides albertanoniae]|uniref:Uncharacterized protein n=1 Tax=Nocardioides albertanoniae TaxID=1175486 RepID=A0A543A8V3_9ACTN|nr:hypothetical protein FB381_2817 [Nocardioides albertanoniae]
MTSWLQVAQVIASAASTAETTEDSGSSVWDQLGEAGRWVTERLGDAWFWAVELIQDLAHGIIHFFHANPGPAFTLLGALVALSTAWLVHLDRARRESNERIRRLLGDFVAAVQERQDARVTLQKRLDSRARDTDVMDFVNQLKMKSPSPATQALNARVDDAQEAVRRAQGRVGSLLFQLSIAQGKRQKHLVFTAKLLDAAETDLEYANAYNFALSLAVHLFADSWQERRRERAAFRRKYRIVLDDWERHIAERDPVDDLGDEESATAPSAG